MRRYRLAVPCTGTGRSHGPFFEVQPSAAGWSSTPVARPRVERSMIISPLAVILLVILAVVIVAFGSYIYFRERRTKLLRSQFGPEYTRTIKQTGNRAEAEERLRER